MGRVVLSMVSKHADTCYIQATATSPSFSAVTTFNCPDKALVDFGKKIKGFPKSVNEKVEYSIGAGRSKADFHFHTVGNTGACELWVMIKGLEDEQGKSATAHFPIDYLESASIEAFSTELIKMGTGHTKTAELKNRFEK